jgi:hypothetical protein
MPINYYIDTREDKIDAEEYQLYELLMNYRESLGLPKIPLSKALTITASRHVLDTVYNLEAYDGHTWSDAEYDVDDPDTYANVWFAPDRIGTGYTDYAFEISVGYRDIDPLSAPNMTPSVALSGWQNSPPHNDIITQQGSWNTNWAAIGVAIHESVAHVWFGRSVDNSGSPEYDIVGTADHESLIGSEANDVFDGVSGDDIINGGGGNDLLFGGYGNDTLSGDDGNDELHGNQGNDSLHGGDGLDTLFGQTGNDTLFGDRGDDDLFGNQGGDLLNGGAGFDRLYGNEGNDTLFGGGGDDTAFFSGPNSNYSVNILGDGSVTVTDRIAGRDGIDTLYNIERLDFSDGVRDVSSFSTVPVIVQTVARLYEAALDRDGQFSQFDGFNFWIDSAEEGAAFRVLAEAFLRSPEFETKYGDALDPNAGDYISNVDFVDILYQNVLGRSGEAAGTNFWVGVLESGASRGVVLYNFSESPENVANTAPLIDTISEISDGYWVFG